MACNSRSVTSSGGIQVKIKSNAEKFWEAILNSTFLFPTAIPSLYATILPSNSDGSVRNITYGEGSPRIKKCEEQIIDANWPVFSYTVLSGDILQYYSSFKGEVSVKQGEDGTWAKWTWEAGNPKANNPIDIEVELEELALKTLGKLDDYLVRA